MLSQACRVCSEELFAAMPMVSCRNTGAQKVHVHGLSEGRGVMWDLYWRSFSLTALLV